jgi:predicted transcriptional regulator
MNEQLKGVLERVESWSEADQAELLEIALEIEARHDAPYRAGPEELAGIDRGIKDADAGRFASDDQVGALLAKFRSR